MILDVLIEARLAGRLDLTRPEHPVFTYDTAYARDGDATPLSTLFPAHTPVTLERLVRHFDGLARDAGRQRSVIGEGLFIDPVGAVSQAGEHRAGWAPKLPDRTGQGLLVDPW